jgi:hypothetical protein
MMPVTIAARRLLGYKYLLRLELITISHSISLLRLGFTFHVLFLPTIEDKRGTKHASSPSKEGSLSPSSAKTPPPAPSRSPPPLGSSSELSSCRPHSSVLEQGGPFGKAPIMDLSSSSDEEGLIPDALQDVEFARRFFGDLNRDILGPPDDGKVIILNDYDEEEVHEEVTADADGVPSSAARIPASTASTVDTDEALKGVQDDNSDNQAPDQELLVVAIVEMKPIRPRLLCQGGTYGRPASRRTSMILHCYSISSFMHRSGDGDAE